VETKVIEETNIYKADKTMGLNVHKQTNLLSDEDTIELSVKLDLMK
jgi:hypothetical protein